jgi:receptor protein-tyrosine kinase
MQAQITPQELMSKISSAPIPQTVLFTITVKDTDPARAQEYTNAVADQLVGLVSELETSRRGGSPAAGVVVIDQANFPTEPTGWGFWLRLGVGAGGGLAVGLLAIIAIAALDRRVRGRKPIEIASGSTVIGALPKDRARAERETVDLEAGGLYVDRLRELRTNVRYSATAPKVLAVTSPSPGDGRTTVTLDLALSLAEAGKLVLVVDGDLRDPVLTDALPVSRKVRNSAELHGLSTLLVGEDSLAAALHPRVDVGHLSVAFLPAGPTTAPPGQLWATEHASGLIEELGTMFDYVIVDTPPLEEYDDAAAIAAQADGALLVGRIGKTTSGALQRAAQSLRSANVTVIGTVVTCEPAQRRDGRSERGDAAPSAPLPDASAPANERGAYQPVVATPRGSRVSK